ncbi:MAG TPA: peptidase U32 family protein [Alphaproteobacteria bacterium]|nr:peptidase U32 family protein [Alphaproteobacteria bacterium]
MASSLELVCPAGTPAALRAAVEAGADAVYCGFADETNARNFPGLNFSAGEMAAAIRCAHGGGAKVLVAINTYPQAGRVQIWRDAVDAAAALQADAVILADVGLLAYAAENHPELRRHLSVQASAASAEAIGFFVREFGVRRVVLPRVLTIEEIEALNRAIDVETEVFVFGGLCVMAEGRCALSSYATGQSPNMNGVCSPACAVRYEHIGGDLVARLGGFAVDRFEAGQPAGYPTLCKGRYRVRDEALYLFEEPTSLSAISILPRLQAAGVTAVKIEGRQRGKAYIAEVVASFRQAIDALADGGPLPASNLDRLAEGSRQTTGAYHGRWR